MGSAANKSFSFTAIEPRAQHTTTTWCPVLARHPTLPYHHIKPCCLGDPLSIRTTTYISHVSNPDTATLIAIVYKRRRNKQLPEIRRSFTPRSRPINRVDPCISFNFQGTPHRYCWEQVKPGEVHPDCLKEEFFSRDGCLHCPIWEEIHIPEFWVLSWG